LREVRGRASGVVAVDMGLLILEVDSDWHRPG